MHKERRKTEDARLTTCRTIIRLFLILIVLAFSPLSGFAQTENSTDVTAEAAQSHSSTVPEHDEPQGAGSELISGPDMWNHSCRTMSQRSRSRSGWYLDEPFADITPRRGLAGTICRGYACCASL